jgi:hypothetical protein
MPRATRHYVRDVHSKWSVAKKKERMRFDSLRVLRVPVLEPKTRF